MTRAHQDSAAPPTAAAAAGLRYVTDAQPGLRRWRVGRHFSYIDPDGKPIHDTDTLQRIKVLAISPAWTDVWICPTPRGHIQATGRDARGRKQYRYHARWREVRDDTKYERRLAFGRALPRIRQRMAADLTLPGLAREKVLAVIVRLLECTLVRIGNEEYARQNRPFGLTTLRGRHVTVQGATLRFHFRGKSGKEHTVGIRDRRLARIVQRCQELPGQELFQYVDEAGERHTIDSADVNAYLGEVAGTEFSAKDFRTWAGTVLAARALQEIGGFDSATQAKSNVVRAIEAVAAQLGNTPAVCRKSYVHPAIVDAYLEGVALPALPEGAASGCTDHPNDLQPAEAAVLTFLRRRLARERAKPAKPMRDAGRRSA